MCRWNPTRVGFFQPQLNNKTKDKRNMKTMDTFAPLACVAAALLTQTSAAQNVPVGGPLVPGYVRTAVHVNQTPPQGAATSQLSPLWYTPAQIRSAYGFNLLPSSINGAGQTIAIVDALGDRYTTTTVTGQGHKTTTTTTTNDATVADWTTFCNQFGLPTTGLTVVYPQGQGAVGPTNSSIHTWAVETALDIQWSHAIAPGANILLVVAPDDSFVSMLGAVDYAVNAGATVVSMSWGGLEFAAELSDDVHFTHSGVTFVASSGDAGEAGLQWPAASPYVLSVGGTTLSDNNGAWSETAWSGGGGGFSLYETMPAFQNGWQQFPTGNMRSVPDVSYVGGPDPGVAVYATPSGGWISVYGTSVGAPQIAALVALANSARASGTVESADSALYTIAAANSTPPDITPAFFNDITTGTNGSDPDDYAIVGYDFVTGLGSPVAQNLVPALAAWTPSPDFQMVVSPSSQIVAPGNTVSYTVTVYPSGGYDGTIVLSVIGLPSGATGTFSPGSLAGSGSATLAIQTSSATPVGTNLVTITGTDATGSPTHSANATLVVRKTMTVSAITYSTSGPHGANVNITLTVVNNLGQPVPNASVSVTVDKNGSLYGSSAAATGSNGEVTFTLNNPPVATYTTLVTAVTASGLTWDGSYPQNSYTK
jgi:subtilase family serine protease